VRSREPYLSSSFYVQIRYLLGFNGRNGAEATRNMLNHVMGTSLALMYNLSGKGAKGKQGFQNLQLYKIMFGKLSIVYFLYILLRLIMGAGMLKKSYRFQLILFENNFVIVIATLCMYDLKYW